MSFNDRRVQGQVTRSPSLKTLHIPNSGDSSNHTVNNFIDYLVCIFAAKIMAVKPSSQALLVFQSFI